MKPSPRISLPRRALIALCALALTLSAPLPSRAQELAPVQDEIPPPPPEAAADAKKEAALIQLVERIEKEIDELDNQSRELNGEFKDRIESIEKSRRALAAQTAELRRELGLPKRPSALSGGGIARAMKRPNFWVGLILVIVIVGAILFILRIFFGRWGGDEDYGPYVEKENELGSVKYPAEAEISSDAAAEEPPGGKSDDEA